MTAGTGGRRDAPAAPLTPAELAAQRNTLNSALGNLGGRQKSWMMANQATPLPSSTLRPSSRKAKSKPIASAPQVQPAQDRPNPPSPQADDSPARHPPSNSTSPQLANVLSRQVHTEVNLLPSPAPSEEANTTKAHSPLLLNEDSAVANAQTIVAGKNNMRVENARVADTSISRASSVDVPVVEVPRQAQFGGKRITRVVNDVNKRRRVGSSSGSSSEMQQQLNRPGPGAGTFVHDSHDNTVRANSGSPACSPNESSDFAHQTTPCVYPEARHQQTSPMMSPSFSERTHPASGFVGYQSQPNNYFTVADCESRLHQFESRYSAEPQTRGMTRLSVLRDAVRRQDWAYLTLHQYYCLYDVDPTQLPQEVYHHPNFPSAIKMLRETLDRNAWLTEPFMQFFANFPMSLYHIYNTWPQRSRQEQQGFQNFLLNVNNFEALKNMCIERKYPPTVREVRNYLGIVSLVFQRIIFTALFRSYWPQKWPRENVERRLDDYFVRSQQAFEMNERNKPRLVPQDYERRAMEAEMQQCATVFLPLYQEMQRQMDPPHQRQLSGRIPLTHVGRSQFPAASLRSPNVAQQDAHASSPIQRNHTPTNAPRGQVLYHSSSRSGQAPVQRGSGHQPMISTQPLRQQPRPMPPVLSFLPARGYTAPQPHLANPDRSALHQMHLASPVLRAKVPGQSLCRFVKGFAQSPARLQFGGAKLETWIFPISAEDLQTVPAEVPSEIGSQTTRMINEQSQLYRLRCIKWAAAEPPSEDVWAVADTSWIPFTYLKMNERPLSLRKKLHHGKDQPIDINSFLQEGDNKLDIAVLRHDDDQTPFNYLLAIEVVAMRTVEAIVQDCLQHNLVPATQTVAAIKDKLGGTSTDDEDISIIQSNLTINLVDPFTASMICNTPARAKSCVHFDCFDLVTFLQTRKKAGDATTVDVWRCPICRADARPQHLIVDGFLQEVRSELEKQGLLETRAIIINSDGTWKPRTEVLSGVRDEDDDNDDYDEHTSAAHIRRSAALPAECIELSD